MRINEFKESQHTCPKCGGPAFSDLMLAEKQDACYAKVKSRYKVWPSAYASGALVQCRKKGAANWGNKSKNESVNEGDILQFPGGAKVGSQSNVSRKVGNITPIAKRTANPDVKLAKDAQGRTVAQGKTMHSVYEQDMAEQPESTHKAMKESGIEFMTDQQFYRELLSVLISAGAVAVAAGYHTVKDMLKLYSASRIMKSLEGRGVSNLTNQEKQELAKLIGDFKAAVEQKQGGQAKQIADQIKHIATTKGMAEGNGMYGDQEVSWEKGGRRAPTGAFRNPAAKKPQPYNDSNWTKNLSKDKLDALAGPRFKKKGVAEGQEVDVNVVTGKLNDIISHAEDVIKNADFEQQVRKATIVRDRAVKALDMIKTGNDAGAAYKYFQTGEQGVAEEYNAEYDDEAGMADNNLETLERAVDGIDELIQAGDNLPEWCQEKIAVAKSMLVTVWDYMKSEEDRGATPELTEEFDLIESCIDRIADHNGVDPEMIWEDLESLSHDELYVFAVTSEPIMEDWSKVNKKDKTDGMSQKAVNAYRRENPGSKLKTAVTTKPSKLKKGSKASKRRKSYCSRSRGQMKMHNISCAKTPDKAICKARRRWNC